MSEPRDLAEHVAAEENGIEREALTSVQCKRVSIVLYQGHLPRMADYEVITPDRRDEVRLRAAWRLLQPYLSLELDLVSVGDVARPLADLRRRLRQLTQH